MSGSLHIITHEKKKAVEVGPTTNPAHPRIIEAVPDHCRLSSCLRLLPVASLINNSKRETMIRRSATLRRVFAVQRRSYRTSSVLPADALDMADTFARRHSKFVSSLEFSVRATQSGT